MGLKKGCIQVYTGEGKGKTTAALGLAFRAAGRGLKVVVLQFMKGPVLTGEIAASEHVPGLEIRPLGRDGFIGPKGPSPEDVALAEKGVEESRNLLAAKSCDVLILDEINVAVSMGLVSEQTVLRLIEARPENMELVLTGRDAPVSFQESADLVTTMTCTKHYFDQGQRARIGIEH
jgi:cob(I)alamin adenosyltransferase